MLNNYQSNLIIKILNNFKEFKKKFSKFVLNTILKIMNRKN